MSKRKFKVNIQSFVSWAAAIIILALGAKILHFPWAEYLIIIGFALEFIVFIVLGFTTRPEGKVHSTAGNPAMLEKMEAIFGQLNKNIEINNKINAALLNEVGVKTIAQALEQPANIASLDIQGLQVKINSVGQNFDILNHTLIELNNHYTKQVEAFKSR